ncbi:MAG: putative lipid II flippase FtsW [Planctomycetota bacterium]
MKTWHSIIYIVVALLGFSIITVFSTDMSTIRSGVNSYQFTKHLLWIFVGTLLLITMAKVDYHYLQKLSIPLLVISFILIALVLIPGIGTVTNGARRWIRFSNFFGIQPSEFAKLSIIIFISSYIAKNHNLMSGFIKGFATPLGITALTSGLIIMEPDFGTSAFIAILSLIMLIVGGTRIIYIFFTAIASVPFIYKLLFEVSFRLDRLKAFLDPWKDPLGAGYHIIQSWIALGSGGLTGLGVGGSRQKLFFLPESSSDFIFTIIGEEFGFIGAMIIISLFVLLIWQGLKIIHAAKDIFGFFLGLGITVMFGLQAAINIAVVSGRMPTKGIPLPFISSGGSSLLFSMIGIGILVNIARQSLESETSKLLTDETETSETSNNSILPLRIWHNVTSKIASFSWR